MVVRREMIVRKSRPDSDKPTQVQFIIRNRTNFDISIKIWNPYPDSIVFEKRCLVVYRSQYYTCYARVKEEILRKENSLTEPIVFLARAITPFNRAELRLWVRESGETTVDCVAFHAYHFFVRQSQHEFCADTVTLEFSRMPVEPVLKSVSIPREYLTTRSHVVGFSIENDVDTAEEYSKSAAADCARPGKEEEEGAFRCSFFDAILEMLFPPQAPSPTHQSSTFGARKTSA